MASKFGFISITMEDSNDGFPVVNSNKISEEVYAEAEKIGKEIEQDDGNMSSSSGSWVMCDHSGSCSCVTCSASESEHNTKVAVTEEVLSEASNKLALVSGSRKRKLTKKAPKKEAKTAFIKGLDKGKSDTESEGESKPKKGVGAAFSFANYKPLFKPLGLGNFGSGPILPSVSDLSIVEKKYQNPGPSTSKSKAKYINYSQMDWSNSSSSKSPEAPYTASDVKKIQFEKDLKAWDEAQSEKDSEEESPKKEKKLVKKAATKTLRKTDIIPSKEKKSFSFIPISMDMSSDEELKGNIIKLQKKGIDKLVAQEEDVEAKADGLGEEEILSVVGEISEILNLESDIIPEDDLRVTIDNLKKEKKRRSSVVIDVSLQAECPYEILLEYVRDTDDSECKIAIKFLDDLKAQGVDPYKLEKGRTGKNIGLKQLENFLLRLPEDGKYNIITKGSDVFKATNWLPSNNKKNFCMIAYADKDPLGYDSYFGMVCPVSFMKTVYKRIKDDDAIDVHNIVVENPNLRKNIFVGYFTLKPKKDSDNQAIYETLYDELSLIFSMLGPEDTTGKEEGFRIFKLASDGQQSKVLRDASLEIALHLDKFGMVHKLSTSSGTYKSKTETGLVGDPLSF